MKNRYVLIGIAIIILGIICGLTYNVSVNKENKKPEYIEPELIVGKVQDECTEYAEILETNNLEEKISPNATFTIKKYYKKCGHTIAQKAQLPTNLVNLKYNELKNVYPDWQIEIFSPLEIVIRKEIEGICEEHFTLKSKDGFIAIYNMNNSNKLELVEVTQISMKYLTDIDVMNLENGIQAIGRENLNRLLEDYE